MSIKFKRDKNGNVIAVNEKGEKIGSIGTMGDNISSDTKTAVKDKSNKETKD